jgi:hypothetical protein
MTYVVTFCRPPPPVYSVCAVVSGSGNGQVPFGLPVAAHAGRMSWLGAPSVSRMMYSWRQPPWT